jgi:hypothetical protein
MFPTRRYRARFGSAKKVVWSFVADTVFFRIEPCGILTWRERALFCSKMASRQKERALTSPKTSALAFISVLPWRINDGLILTVYRRR